MSSTVTRILSFLEHHKNHLVSIIFFTSFAGQALRYAFGWVGFGIISVILFSLTVYLFRKSIPDSLRGVPIPLGLFLGWCALSVLWSHYRSVTILGTIIQLVTVFPAFIIAKEFSWEQITRCLSNALKWILGASLVFEVFVSLIAKHPFYPLVGAVKGYFWSDDNLLKFGPVQGIVGNRNLLAFIALLGLIVFLIEHFQGNAKTISTIVWVNLSILACIFTGSATITLSILALISLTVLVLALRNFKDKHRRIYYITGGAVLSGIAFITVYSSALFSLVGRDKELSGRTIIWHAVGHLVKEEPILGWGWVSYWAPWVEPFKTLAILNGTQFLQAHDAFLDIVFQVGLIGGAFALAVAIVTSLRACNYAVHNDKSKGVLTLLPVLLLAALLIQSITESRLLIEGNWLLFALLCWKLKSEIKLSKNSEPNESEN